MRRLGLFLAALLMAVPTFLDAQEPAPRAGQPPAAPAEQGAPPASAPQGPEAAVPAPPDDDPFADIDFGGRGTAFRLGGDYTLRAGQIVDGVIVIMGNVVIEGTATDDVVVITGTARLAPTARVENLIVIGGRATIEEGAVVLRDLVVIGGGLDAPPGYTTRGEQVIIGPPLLGAWFEGFTTWLTRGLLFGRLVVPDLGWVWGAVALFFLIYLAINVIFQHPVGTVAGILVEKPLTAFGVGLLVLLLFGPVAMLLAVSVIGIAVIPFLVAAMFAAWIVGKVAVARWIGHSVVPEQDPDQRAQAARSFLIGFAIIIVAYMIPLLGIVTWAVVGVLGLGAASLAFIAAYRRERPAPPIPETPPPPVPMPYQPAGFAETPTPPTGVTQASGVPPEHTPAAGPPPLAAGGVGGASPAGAPAASVAMPLAVPSTLLSMPKALFRDRFAAFVLDIIILVVAVRILDNLLFWRDDAFLFWAFVYFVAFWTWKQTTPGGIICQLRLVRIDGQPLSFPDALIRAVVGFFSIVIFFIGALWMLRDPESQTWHDKVAGTYVVKVPRGWPL